MAGEWTADARDDLDAYAITVWDPEKVLEGVFGKQYVKAALWAINGSMSGNWRRQDFQEYVSVAALWAVEHKTELEAKIAAVVTEAQQKKLAGWIERSVLNAIEDYRLSASLSQYARVSTGAKRQWRSLDVQLEPGRAEDDDASLSVLEIPRPPDSGISVSPVEEHLIPSTAKAAQELEADWYTFLIKNIIYPGDPVGLASFTLVHMNGMSVRDAAAILGVNSTAVFRNARRGADYIKSNIEEARRRSGYPVSRDRLRRRVTDTGCGRGAIYYGDELAALRGRILQAADVHETLVRL